MLYFTVISFIVGLFLTWQEHRRWISPHRNGHAG